MFNMLHFFIKLWVFFIYTIAYYVIEVSNLFNERQNSKNADSNFKKIKYKLTKKKRCNTQFIKKQTLIDINQLIRKKIEFMKERI